MKSTTLLLVFLFAFEAVYCNSSKPLIIDIGAINPNTIFSSTDNNLYDSLIIKNLVAGLKYNIEINKESSFPLSLKLTDLSGAAGAAVVPTECENLFEAVSTLNNYQGNSPESLTRNEKELSILVKAVEDAKKTCTDTNLKAKALKAIKDTQQPYQIEIKADRGETVTIIIKRDSLTWTYILKGESLGKWVTSYGFGFTSSAIGGSTYYAKQLPDTSLYKILKSKNTNNLDLNYIPAVFFSYFPSQNFNKPWNHSLTAGLGFDLSAPVVFFGYNAMFWQNLGFSLGVAFQQQYKLKDKYTENDVITYLPDKEQVPSKEDLHEKVYRPNLFIAINFRFGENPFKSKDEKEK